MLSSSEITTFLAVVRSGSLIKAAETIFTTQSTVSYRLAALERKLGRSLITRARGGRKITLTSDGELFLDIAERWQVLEIEAESFRKRTVDFLSVGCVDALSIHFLGSVFERLSANMPQLRLHIETARGWEIAERVATGHLHVGFTFSDIVHADLQIDHVTSFETCIAVAGTPALSINEVLPVSRFDPLLELYLPWNTAIDTWRDTQGLSKLATRIEKSHLLPPLLSRRGVWALIPSLLAKSLSRDADCNIVRCTPQPPAIHVYKLTRRKLSTAHTFKMDQLESALASLHQGSRE